MKVISRENLKKKLKKLGEEDAIVKRFATVFDDNGKPRLIIEGESTASVKRYVHLSSYKPVIGDKVILFDDLILGNIGAYRGGEGGTVDAPTLAQFNAHLNDGAAHGIGNKSELLTTEKASIVKAMNELFTIANDIKVPVATAISAKGVPASPSDTGVVLADKIMQIKTAEGKKSAKGNFRSGEERVFVDTLDFTPSFIFIRGNITTYSRYRQWALYYTELNANYWVGADEVEASDVFTPNPNGFSVSVRYSPGGNGAVWHWVAVE